jgi:hypothetical protein
MDSAYLQSLESLRTERAGVELTPDRPAKARRLAEIDAALAAFEAAMREVAEAPEGAPAAEDAADSTPRETAVHPRPKGRR